MTKTIVAAPVAIYKNWDDYLAREMPDAVLGYVYFIGPVPDGPIKIGFTSDVEERLRQLQTGNHVELRIWTAIRGPQSLEACYHSKHRADRIRGEWFNLSPALLRTLKVAVHDAPARYKPNRNRTARRDTVAAQCAAHATATTPGPLS